MNPFRPGGQRVLIKMDAVEGESKGGILLPQQYREENTIGEVVRVGPGQTYPDGTRIPFEVKVGDRVLVPIYVGQEFYINKQLHKLVMEDDIMAIADAEVRPLGDRVVVFTLKMPGVSKGGIIFDNSQVSDVIKAKVISVGNGKLDCDGKKIPAQVKKGDNVLLAKYGITDVSVYGVSCSIVKESDILCVVGK